MNRSLTELKICLYVALPLLCLVRTIERIEVLVIAPITAQRTIFGRVLAFPWKMELADIAINRDADIFDTWTFVLPDVPEPLKACRPDITTADKPNPRYSRSCSMGSGPAWLNALWGKGRLYVRRAIVTSRPD